MNRSDAPTSTGPMPEPGSDPLVTLLSAALADEAGRFSPDDRLEQIRHQVGRRRRIWVPVAAAAASAIVLGSVTWAATDRSGHRVAHPPAVVPTAPATPLPSDGTSSSPTASTHVAAVPVYYAGRGVAGLFREFHQVPVRDGTAGRLDGLDQAIRLALDPASPVRPNDASPWLTGTSAAATWQLSGSTVVLTLPAAESQPRAGARAVGWASDARLAAQQLAWTVSATLQDPGVGVRIRFAGAPSGRLFGTLPVTAPFHRPPAALAYQDLSPIWILAPAFGATVTSPVVISGQACTFEAAVSWQLVQNRRDVRTGHTTASIGCPVRGTWSVTLAGLAPGSYVFRAYSLGAKSGTTFEGLDDMPFTVR